MKKNEFQELKGKNIQDLLKLAENLRQELKKIQVEKTSGKIKNTNLAGQKRKDLARLLTVIKGKETVT